MDVNQSEARKDTPVYISRTGIICLILHNPLSRSRKMKWAGRHTRAQTQRYREEGDINLFEPENSLSFPPPKI